MNCESVGRSGKSPFGNAKRNTELSGRRIGASAFHQSCHHYILHMKVRYLFPLGRPIKLPDHWPIPMLNGTARMVEDEDGLVIAVEFEKSGCPIDLAFRFDETPDAAIKGTISGSDYLVTEVRDHLDRAFSYLQCYFSTEFELNRISITHEAETDEEAERIVIHSFDTGKQDERPLPITYDFITRAIMAAENADAPQHEASLAHLARENLASERYIDSFRYSFLLVEDMYGNGQSQKWELVDALESHPRLVEIIEHEVATWQRTKNAQPSSTDDLMSNNPSTREVITHLVERRGHYFHANKRKPKAWSAKNQKEAESLAWFAVGIAQTIGHDAAEPMFAPEFVQRHFDEAGQMGAHVTMKIEYLYRIPEQDFIRKRELVAKLPGTKITTQMAMQMLRNALEHFEQNEPVGTIHSIDARAEDGSEVFTVRFQTEKDGEIVDP